MRLVAFLLTFLVLLAPLARANYCVNCDTFLSCLFLCRDGVNKLDRADRKLTTTIVFLGPAGVGKTSIIFRLLGSGMSRQKSTIQDIYCLQDLNIPTLNAVMNLNIEDTGGQFYQIICKYQNSFEEVTILREAISEEFPELPLIIIGNKLDLVNTKNMDKVPDSLVRREVEAVVCLGWEASYLEFSALKGGYETNLFLELAIRAEVDAARSKDCDLLSFGRKERDVSRESENFVTFFKNKFCSII